MAILIRRDGLVATVAMADAQALNALSVVDVRGLAAAWDELEADPGVRVVVLTGEGERAFCSGANLKDFIPLLTEDLRKRPDPVAAFREMDFLHRAFLKPQQLSKPLIAAVNGICFAGGMELLQACDIRVAVNDAVFSLQEPRWGLFPAGGSTVRLPRQIPFAWAMEILLTGGRLTAPQAVAVGLINRAVPRAELGPTVQNLAEQIAANGPLAVRAIKRSALDCLDLPLSQAFAEELRWAAPVFVSEDAREGPRAFAEKRPPDFQGR
jgi:enoyl-CoA hydratase